MHHFASEDLAEDYCLILKYVRDKGTSVAPRGLETKEILSFTLELRDPARALVRGTNRKIHVGLAAAEALQLVGGFSDPGALMQVSPHFSEFTDGGVFHAPYGPRIATQIQPAIDWLWRDKDTRKAWIQVWDPMADLLTHDTRDHPCTTAIQFMIRDEKLNAHVFMRANDAWRGFPYDVFQFSQLQQAVAGTLGIEPGIYFHHATSFHLYDTNLPMVEGLTSSSQAPIRGVEEIGAYRALNWGHMQQRARAIFYDSEIFGESVEDLHEGELVMWNALRRVGVEGKW